MDFPICSFAFKTTNKIAYHSLTRWCHSTDVATWRRCWPSRQTCSIRERRPSMREWRIPSSISFAQLKKKFKRRVSLAQTITGRDFFWPSFFVFFVDRDFWLLRLLLLRSVLILPTTLVRMNALKMGQSRHFAAGVKIIAIVFSLLFFTDCVSFLDHFLDESNNNEETLCHEMSITKQTTKSRGEKMQYTRTKEKQWIEK